MEKEILTVQEMEKWSRGVRECVRKGGSAAPKPGLSGHGLLTASEVSSLEETPSTLC